MNHVTNHSSSKQALDSGSLSENQSNVFQSQDLQRLFFATVDQAVKANRQVGRMDPDSLFTGIVKDIDQMLPDCKQLVDKKSKYQKQGPFIVKYKAKLDAILNFPREVLESCEQEDHYRNLYCFLIIKREESIDLYDRLRASPYDPKPYSAAELLCPLHLFRSAPIHAPIAANRPAPEQRTEETNLKRGRDNPTQDLPSQSQNSLSGTKRIATADRSSVSTDSHLEDVNNFINNSNELQLKAFSFFVYLITLNEKIADFLLHRRFDCLTHVQEQYIQTRSSKLPLSVESLARSQNAIKSAFGTSATQFQKPETKVRLQQVLNVFKKNNLLVPELIEKGWKAWLKAMKLPEEALEFVE